MWKQSLAGIFLLLLLALSTIGQQAPQPQREAALLPEPKAVRLAPAFDAIAQDKLNDPRVVEIGWPNLPISA